ncbi:MAG TPA: translocation/assembly module TamB domain-containing protein [Thermodesulfobacteriota bacterium]|nr:translocation/assembly module TamB domain-containing protein [Thermodesulfobacteriota bacterium]
MRHKVLIAAAVVIVILVIVTIAAYFFTQTSYFRSLVKNTAERLVSSATGQSFSIGSVEGNFFYNIKLKDVKFEVEKESFVEVDELSVTYSIPRMLDTAVLSSRIIPVDGITLNGARVSLIKYGDGTWNFGKIGNRSIKEKDKEKEKKGPPEWSIIVSGLDIQGSSIKVDDRESGKVSEYRIDNTSLSAKLINITEDIQLDIKNADLEAPSQGLTVKGLKANAGYTGDKAKISGLELTLNGAGIKLDAEATGLKDTPEISYKLSASGYKVEDVGTFSVESKGKGVFKGPKNIDAKINIEIPESELFGKKISGTLDNITVSGTTLDLGSGNIQSDLGGLTLSGEGKLTRLISGEGKNSFSVRASLKDINTTEVFSLIEEKTQKTAGEISTKLGAILNADLSAEGSWAEFGDMTVNGKIERLDVQGKKAGKLSLTGTASYSPSGVGADVKTALKQVDLGTILGRNNLHRNLISNLSIKGLIPLEGDVLQKMNAAVKGSVGPSSIFNINIKKGDLDASYDKERLTVRALSIDGDSFDLRVKGGSANRKGINLGYEIDVKDLGLISKFAPGVDLSGTLKASGKADGPINNPHITVDAEAGDLKINDVFSTESLKITGDGSVDLNNPDLRAKISTENAKIKDRDVESIEIDAASKGKGINVNALIKENENYEYEAAVTLIDLGASEKHVEIGKLRLDMDEMELVNRDRILLTIAPEKLIVDSFNLYYDDSSALADARIFYNGSVEGKLRLKNLSLNDIVQAINPKADVNGAISADADISGTAADPQFSVKVTTKDLAYKDFKNDVSLDLNYLNRSLNMKFLVTGDSGTVLTASGNSDVNLDLNNLSKNLEDARFNLTVHSDGVDLSPLTSVSSEIEKSSGLLVLDVRADGTLRSPRAEGKITLKDGVFKIKSLGNELKVVNAVIELDGQKGYLRQAEIDSGKGKGTFEGKIDVSSLTYDLNGNMKNFLLKPKRITAEMTGNLDLKGEGAKVDIGGKVTVAKARINIPEKEEKQIEEIKYVDEGENEFVVGGEGQADYFKDNVALNLAIRMRKNNWVKGRGANIELKGDLDINKKYGEDVRISGTITTVRGTYETLGKLFRIQEGTVNFTGSEKINPLLDITALYRVSSVQIYVNITGTPEKPVLKLTSDPDMTETDIISYIVFGAPSDQIGSRDRASIQGVATGVAGGIAAAQLEKLLGSKLSLDVVSVGGGTNGPQLEVGKYLTQDLYIAYERETSESLIDSTTITQNKVLLEYTIFKNVTINGDVGGENPGVDVFHNFNY